MSLDDRRNLKCYLYPNSESLCVLVNLLWCELNYYRSTLLWSHNLDSTSNQKYFLAGVMKAMEGFISPKPIRKQFCLSVINGSLIHTGYDMVSDMRKQCWHGARRESYHVTCDSLGVKSVVGCQRWRQFRQSIHFMAPIYNRLEYKILEPEPLRQSDHSSNSEGGPTHCTYSKQFVSKWRLW